MCFISTDAVNGQTIVGVAKPGVIPADNDLRLVPYFNGIYDLIYEHFTELEQHHFKW